jgi:hypothetical protein
MKFSCHPAVFVFFFLFPAIIAARDISVYVEDKDLEMPLEGAAVTLRSGQRFICDGDGIAHVSLPDDRQTIVIVTYPGYETLRLTIPAADAAAGNSRFTAAMRLGGIMQGQELVLEAARPETSETRSGRSVAITERELERTAEIGIIEDVMNSVKLLPGVGYSGMFSAMPSIRGGDPGDLTAVLDGFYLERPYHWMGGISIFDPKMISSARLSHGVFSARYGHTISGLLEVTSKSPSPTETELEAAVGSSAASLNLSLPLGGRGGVLFMGKITYWDTLIWAAQGLSKAVEDENLNMVNYITTAPYIRSAALSMNYRITPDMDWRLNAFFGSDGIGADFITDYSRFTDDGVQGIMEMQADYDNYQGFFITGLNASPNTKLTLRFTGGAGFIRAITEDMINNNITASYNDNFLDTLPPFLANSLRGKTYTAPNINAGVEMENSIFNAQIRADADIDLGKGFIAAFGVHELYSMWALKEDINLSFIEFPVAEISQENINVLPQELQNVIPFLQGIPNLAIIMPRSFNGDVTNHGFTTSAYGLVEYTSPDQRIGVELGLRVDHLFFMGKNFSIATEPAVNPRLNIDFNILKNYGNIDSLIATAGTGLFSSINSLICFFDPDQFGTGTKIDLDNIEMKFNRSWTTVIGLKLDFLDRYSFAIEGYYKHIFDRAYITADISASAIVPELNFDGVGEVWGFDLQLQRLESRYFDGWISYSFTWARYNDPHGGGEGVNMGSLDSVGGDWYYPSFHRFHNCNIVLNIKPFNWFNIGIRFGFASGQPADKVSDTIESYPVIALDENGVPALDENGKPVIIQKYRRDSWYDDNERSAWSLPLDIKLTFFTVNKSGRSSMEIYVAAENILSLVYRPSGNTTFNSYTGKEDTGRGGGNFNLPIPLVSFGFKWRY